MVTSGGVPARSHGVTTGMGGSAPPCVCSGGELDAGHELETCRPSAARLINRYSVCASVLCLHGAVYWLRWPAGASLRDTAGRLCQLVAQALRGYNAITF